MSVCVGGGGGRFVYAVEKIQETIAKMRFQGCYSNLKSPSSLRNGFIGVNLVFSVYSYRFSNGLKHCHVLLTVLLTKAADLKNLSVFSHGLNLIRICKVHCAKWGRMWFQIA